MRYIYYAKLFDDGNCVGVEFPDFPTVNTFGNNEFDAIDMAQEALDGYLVLLENDGDNIKSPSAVADIALSDNERLIAIHVNTDFVRERNRNKLIKKTLTLPAYVDRAGREAGINFSQLLQNAIKKELHIA